MTDFNEAADALRTAQIQKLEAELKIARELAEDRLERIRELAAMVIGLKDDLDFAKRQPLYSTRRAAERYRWLRAQEDFEVVAHTGAELDAIIDRGMEKG